jgi:hypothetical protein
MMKFRRHEMRNEPRTSAILAVAVLMAVALPVSVALTREAEPPREIAARSTFALPVASIQPSALPPAAIQMTPEVGVWSDEASQSAYMVLVGSLLIGIGSIVRRTV